MIVVQNYGIQFIIITNKIILQFNIIMYFITLRMTVNKHFVQKWDTI